MLFRQLHRVLVATVFFSALSLYLGALMFDFTLLYPINSGLLFSEHLLLLLFATLRFCRFPLTLGL